MCFHYFGTADDGGVHTNSGVQNFWFYLLANRGSGINDNGISYNVTGIGFEKASAIAYRNLKIYLHPTDSFPAAVLGSIQSAEDLYGINSPESNGVKNAWCAVGLSTCSTPFASDNINDRIWLLTHEQKLIGKK